MNLKQLLNEINFASQAAFDAYKEKHKVRDTTKVNIAGKETTAGAASKKSDSVSKPKGGASASSKKVEPKKAEEPKKEEPKSEPAKKRPGNPTVNKEAKKQAEEFGITPNKLGNEGYKKAMYQAAVEALTDANFHDEARELIASIEGKPEWAKKVKYPSMDDPKYKEKMADLRKNGVDSSEYWGGEDGTHEYGRKVASAAGWGGVEAADGIAFTLRMNGFHREADKIQSVFDNKGYMKNEGRISLTKMVKENDSKHFDTGLSDTEDSEAERDFNQHHATSMYAKHMGTPAEKDTIDFDDNEPNEPGVQDSDAKKKDKVDRGYEPVVKNESLSLKGALGEAKSDYPVYHYTYTSAIQSAREYAEKKGYEIDDEDAFRQIGMGPKKPSDGKTNRFSIQLTKDGKPQKKHLHIQVYGMGTYKRNTDGSKTRSLHGGQNEYELNAYIN
jgi:hypothetical protein